jgi:hypothetical protein
LKGHRASEAGQTSADDDHFPGLTHRLDQGVVNFASRKTCTGNM